MPGLVLTVCWQAVEFQGNFKGTGIFQLSRRGNDNEWQTNLLGVISKYRSIDIYLKEQINSGKIYICERHFLPEDIEFTSDLFCCCFAYVYAILYTRMLVCVLLFSSPIALSN